MPFLYNLVMRTQVFFLLCSIIDATLLPGPFNMTKFLNMPETANSSIESYTKSHMCPFPSGSCCGCDIGYCMKEKTCCINALWNPLFTGMQDEYVSYFLSQSKQYKNQECSYTIPKRFVKVKGDVLGYYMVTTCQDDTATKEIKDKCIMGSLNDSTMEYYIPVKDKKNYFYRNKYCALCNSVKEFEMTTIIRACGFEDKCKIKPFNHKGMPCRPDAIEVNKTCSRGNKYYDLCRAFIGPVGNHANYFCYLCNGGSPSYFPAPFECEIDPGTSTISWSTLLRFDYSDKKDPKCKNVEILDGTTQECSPFVCPTGYQAQNSKCVAMGGKTTDSLRIKDASFDKCLQARQPRIILKDFSNFTTTLEKLFSTDKQSSKNMFLVAISNNMRMIDGLARNESLEFIKGNEVKIKDYIKENETIILAVSNPLNNSLSPSKIFPNNSICADPILLNSSLNFTDNCDEIVNGEKISFSDISLILEINKNGFTRNAYICKNYYLSKPCPRKVLDANQTTIDNNKSLVYDKGSVKRIFQVHEYEPYTDGSYTVCIDTTKNEIGPWWFSTVDKVAGYVSIVGSSCSILCLIVLILTILQFKKLRNFPGLCTLALSINLLIGDVLFLTMNLMYTSSRLKHMTTLCDVIGVLIHFFLLSAQIWGLVMAVDISINLTKSSISNQKNKSKFIWFNFIPVLIAAIFITMALLFRNNNILDISYNKDGLCILHGFYGRIFLFFLPLLICFFVSSTVLSISIGYIEKERRKSKNVLKGSSQNKTSVVRIALKLVVVCGIAEGIGIINIPTGRNSSHGLFIVNSIFILLYSFVKGFRGVMLFIVYVCRKPVYDMYLRKHTKSGSTSTTMNSFTNNSSSIGNSRNDTNSNDSQL